MGITYSKLVAEHILDACERSSGDTIDPALLNHPQVGFLFSPCLVALLLI
jgi:hypothetical protein